MDYSCYWCFMYEMRCAIWWRDNAIVCGRTNYVLYDRNTQLCYDEMCDVNIFHYRKRLGLARKWANWNVR